MDKFKYDIYFVGGTHIDFTTGVDMDFHKISPTAIAYDELYINMANVTFMKKNKLLAEELPDEYGREHFKGICPYTNTKCEKWTCSVCEVEKRERRFMEGDND